MNILWALMGLIGILWGLATGRGAALTEGSLSAAIGAVQLCVRLAGGFALWSGMMAILERSGAVKALTRLIRPLLARLFPGVGDEARYAIAMNLTTNMLGLGNAATPMGLEAMRRMGETVQGETASDAMCMFLVINASSVQLFPTTVVALRAAAGSANPASVVLPTLVATILSTLTGICACLLFKRLGRGRAG